MEKQDANEQAWRQLLAQNVLAVLLPIEDLQNGCLRALVEQILAEMIVGNVISSRLCESWALWDLITNAIETIRARGDTDSAKGKTSKSKKKSDKVPDGKNDTPSKSGIHRLEQYGLLNAPIQPESQLQTANVTRISKRINYTRKISALKYSFWTLLHYGFFVIMAGRAVVMYLLSSTNFCSRGSFNVSKTGVPSPAEAESTARNALPKSVRPIIDMTAWKTLANLVELPVRMPWLSGLLSLVQWTAITGPGSAGKANGRVDR